jgi:hypothetical protein
MVEHIDNISRLMDHPEPRGLSLTEAKALLASRANKNSEESILTPTLRLIESLKGFASGRNTISEVRQLAEAMSEKAEDTLSLIRTIVGSPEPDRGGYGDQEIAPLGSCRYHEAALHLMESIRGYLAGRRAKDALIEEAAVFDSLIYNTYRNSIILESHIPNRLLPDDHTMAEKAIEVFDRLLVEMAVGSGAIAIRPAALDSGRNEQPKDIFPKKRQKKWYLRYALE